MTWFTATSGQRRNSDGGRGSDHADSLYLQNMKGVTALETGLAFRPMSFVTICTVALVQTRILLRTGPRPLIPAGMLLAAGSASASSSRPQLQPHEHLAHVGSAEHAEERFRGALEPVDDGLLGVQRAVR